MHVNEAFFAEYKRKAWREDHYICVDGSLCWLNQYPLSEGRFTEERLKEVSGRLYVRFSKRARGYGERLRKKDPNSDVFLCLPAA